jgi:hemoglobin
LLWVCNVSDRSYQFTDTRWGKTPLGLEEAHRDLRISPVEFDEVAAELRRTLVFFKIPAREKTDVLAGFAALKDEVTTAGCIAAATPQAERPSAQRRNV